MNGFALLNSVSVVCESGTCLDSNDETCLHEVCVSDVYAQSFFGFQSLWFLFVCFVFSGYPGRVHNSR